MASLVLRTPAPYTYTLLQTSGQAIEDQDLIPIGHNGKPTFTLGVCRGAESIWQDDLFWQLYAVHFIEAHDKKRDDRY